MPTRTTTLKRRARAAAAGASKRSFDAFLAILNDGRVELPLRGAGPSAKQTSVPP
jgi:hypothetical protein